jgi:membrane-bound hydrogenase subunit beta
MSAENEIQNALKAAFGEQISEVKAARERRLFVTIALPQLKQAVSYLKDNWGLTHITTITAIDVGEEIELLYHFFCQGVTLSLRTFVPKANPVIDTITAIIPGATLYEREIQDLLGLKVIGHPDPRRLILPEDWPDGVYPLRKDYGVKMKEG